MAGSRKLRITGWVLSLLLAALLGMSASMKFFPPDKMVKEMGEQGFTVEMMKRIGVLEVVFALLFLVPRTSFVGAILLTAYFGGATLTHMRGGESVVPPIAIGVLAWVALGLRMPEVFKLAFCTSCCGDRCDAPTAKT